MPWSRQSQALGRALLLTRRNSLLPLNRRRRTNRLSPRGCQWISCRLRRSASSPLLAELRRRRLRLKTGLSELGQKLFRVPDQDHQQTVGQDQARGLEHLIRGNPLDLGSEARVVVERQGF